MAEQVRKPRPQETKESLETLAEQDAEVQAAQVRGQADLEGLDDLLDEIDGLLEEQDVLTNFKQRGGQ